jgi:hypothetical protein
MEGHFYNNFEYSTYCRFMKLPCFEVTVELYIEFFHTKIDYRITPLLYKGKLLLVSLYTILEVAPNIVGGLASMISRGGLV